MHDLPQPGGAAAPRIRLVSCVGVGLDLAFLPHFLRHYAGLGIEPAHMHFILNAGEEEGAALERAEAMLAEFGAAPPRLWRGTYSSEAMWAERRALQREVAAPEEWIVNSDVDEHYSFPAPLPEIVEHCRQVGATCVQGLQIDRFAADGTLAPVADAPALAEQFPSEGEASFHIFGGGKHQGISGTTKIMLHRADVFPRRGGHNPEGLTKDSRGAASADGPRFLAGRPLHTFREIADPAFRFAFPFQSAHYKWTAARLPSIERRLSAAEVSPAGREFGGKVQDYMAQNGRIRLDDVALRAPGDRPEPNWRGAMAALRHGMSDVFVVIRAAGERTEDLCRELVRAELPDAQIALIREVPFAAAVRRAFELGVAAGRDWTLCLDADVLLRPGALAELLAAARAQPENTFGVCGRVADPLLGQWRVAGQHLYRTKWLGKALEEVRFDPEQRRPESHVKRQMKGRGHDWADVDVAMGLHDAEQSFADIFRKVVVHTRKHDRFMGYARRYWERLGGGDADLRVALWALEAPERIADVRPPQGEGARNVQIDRRHFPERIDAFLGEVGLQEKPPLVADAFGPEEISRRLEAFAEAPEWLEDREQIEADHAREVTRRAQRPRLISCIGVDGPGDGDLPLLPHFLKHYLRLGISRGRIHLILNAASADSPNLARAREIVGRFGTAPPEVWVGPYTSGDMWDRRRALQQKVAGPDDWIVNADADEFHAYPAPLDEVTEVCAELGVRCVQGPFVDRIASDGRLAPVEEGRPLFAQFPLAADVGGAIGKRPGAEDATGTVKLMLHRGDVVPGLGGHSVQNVRPAALVYNLPLQQFPRIKAPEWRFRLPFLVWHFKWTAGLAEGLEARRSTAGASAAGSSYGGRILDYLHETGGRIVPEHVRLAPEGIGEAHEGWRDEVTALAEAGARLRPVRTRAVRQRKAAEATAASLAPGWRVRQLTFGSAGGAFHAHSYYDIPVLSDDASRVAAYRMGIEGRWMTPRDAVEIGIVDVERGGFAPVGTSHAWSWQQGPMAQWLPGDRGLVWNDRASVGAEGGDAFVARLYDTATGETCTLPRPVYCLAAGGQVGLSLNMARLDKVRPGYGYPGGAGTGLDEGAPEGDGIWAVSLVNPDAPPRLLLPLSRAVQVLAAWLPEAEREEHLSGALVHWFNHAKVSPDGRRFTAKLRWRAADLKSRWTGLMGVSITCGMDGEDMAILARGTSHVMWDGPDRLYFWHQAEKRFVTMTDAVPEGTNGAVPHPDLITANVHFRHIPDAPMFAVYDTPYEPEIDVMWLDRQTGEAERLARFHNHQPPHGPYRCDLHPVPSRDGRRIIVTSLQDGGRQIYVLEREASA
ncbi:glycosyltransferase family 2 protein [Pseudoroseicyclus tamaricis]|uniref:Glycosyl transferase family 2 n=1 Tax=Pseudoroseicyclus tamaricis TaxID=2705421 RepID=A0A6B2JV57_9RHOB|nr:glycosyltransferase family 2 protein [Pseudoroseicyclus tamaricis]NDV00064.1 hypothetical protein [Pseudoroseicyclus tamaricis]